MFRDDFKTFLCNAKLRSIESAECPEISADPASRLFGSLFLVLAGSFFADLNDSIDNELHSLVRCVPRIMAAKHLNEAS